MQTVNHRTKLGDPHEEERIRLMVFSSSMEGCAHYAGPTRSSLLGDTRCMRQHGPPDRESAERRTQGSGCVRRNWVGGRREDSASLQHGPRKSASDVSVVYGEVLCAETVSALHEPVTKVPVPPTNCMRCAMSEFVRMNQTQSRGRI